MMEPCADNAKVGGVADKPLSYRDLQDLNRLTETSCNECKPHVKQRKVWTFGEEQPNAPVTVGWLDGKQLWKGPGEQQVEHEPAMHHRGSKGWLYAGALGGAQSVGGKKWPSPSSMLMLPLLELRIQSWSPKYKWGFLRELLREIVPEIIFLFVFFLFKACPVLKDTYAHMHAYTRVSALSVIYLFYFLNKIIKEILSALTFSTVADFLGAQDRSFSLLSMWNVLQSLILHKWNLRGFDQKL